MASFLARRVLETWQAAYLDDPDRHRRMPVVSLALEEAQRVLGGSKDRESNVFPRVAREGRKFGVGLCAVTQQPKLLEDELLSQFNTFFILGLADEKDRNMLRTSAKQDISAQGAGDPDPDAGRVPDRQPGRPVRRAGHDRPVRGCGPTHSPATRPPSGRRRPTSPPWSTETGPGPGASGPQPAPMPAATDRSPPRCAGRIPLLLVEIAGAAPELLQGLDQGNHARPVQPGLAKTSSVDRLGRLGRHLSAGEVISASVVRPSVGCGTRTINPCSSSRLTALVTLVGWTCRREPTLLSGRAPARLNSSSIRTS